MIAARAHQDSQPVAWAVRSPTVPTVTPYQPTWVPPRMIEASFEPEVPKLRRAITTVVRPDRAPT